MSNSRWAHATQLIVATQISDEAVAEELRRLGTSYDVSVLSFGLSKEYLDDLPDAGQIRKFSPQRVEQEMLRITPKTIASGRDHENLDWEHIRDLQKQHVDMRDLFSWISKCLKDCKPYQFDFWQAGIK